MSRRPNFAFAATQALSGGSYGAEGNPNAGGYKPTVFAKPFDGFKTTNITGNYNPKHLDAPVPNKFGGTAPYGSAGISVSAMEKNLKKDIQDLDWELEVTKKYTPVTKTSETEATLKPKLFQKKQATHEKQEFNNTGETRATVSNTVAASDWDLPETFGGRMSTNTKPAANKLTVPAKKHAEPVKITERSAANDWDLGDSQPKPPVSGNKPSMPAKQK